MSRRREQQTLGLSLRNLEVIDMMAMTECERRLWSLKRSCVRLWLGVVLSVTVAHNSSGGGCNPPGETAIGVVSVDWVEMDSALDTNPNTGNGKRIYPGKQTPSDSTNRKKVKVRATIGPAISGRTIYFKVFDINDPYSDSSPIDSNGSDGGDNRGGSGSLSATSATTDANGKAEVELTVTMQPGDNFRVGAHCDTLSAVTDNDVPANNDPDVSGQPGKYTEMLTVWRKLHMELDSMAEVPATGDEKNSVAGSITSVSGSGPWTVTTDQALDDTDMYEKGTLVKGGNYTVKTGAGANSSGANSTVTVTTGDPGSGAFTSLTDDDAMTMPHYPDTGKLNSIFDDCYIYCTADLTGTDDVSFDVNLDPAEAEDLRDACDHDSVADAGDDFWIVYVLAGYQLTLDLDHDPDSGEDGVGGATTPDLFQVSIICLETIADRANAHPPQTATALEQINVVHEIGHQVLESDTHTDDTIMQEYLDNLPSASEKFSDSDIATIRSKTSSPGI